jgi:ubiquinone biosynthesis protein COQ9
MPNDTPKDRLLNAALAHAPFDGWSEATLAAAARDCGIPIQEARALFPRDGVSLASAAHLRGDDALAKLVGETDLSHLRYSEKVAELVWLRLLAAGDKEAVRAATTLFALPQNAAEGARLIWGTADLIWRLLGDTSDDINWYSKRAILSGVYGSSVLFWLGDKSESDADTRAFIDRRIANVMQFEKFKSQVRANPVLARLLSVPESLLSGIKAPSGKQRDDLPGRWGGETQENK